MTFRHCSLAFAGALLASGLALGQTPAGAPAGSTGLCKDGSFTSTASKRGSCGGHKGVKDWYGADAEAAPAKTAMPAPTPTAPATKATAPSETKMAAPSTTTAPAAGGGAGEVWVNSSTKVYHCQGTKWYGKTKHGEYMTEAAAKASGSHADHAKACS